MVRQVGYPIKQMKNERACTACGCRNFYRDPIRGESICTSCGCVVTGHEFNTGPEWRAFTTEERNAKARTGTPPRLIIADKGLATTIGRSYRDAARYCTKGHGRAAIYRMRKWQIRSWTHGLNLRNLNVAFIEMNRLSSQLGVPDKIKETAAFIYRRALAKRIVRGRTIDGMVAASIYLSCRIHKTPRQLDEIAAQAKVERKNLGRCVRIILLGADIRTPLPSARNLVSRISSDLSLEGRTVRKAISIIAEAKKKGITVGKHPGGIAGASLYIAGIVEDDRRTQKEIASASRVTEVTIRNRYMDMVRELGIILE